MTERPFTLREIAEAVGGRAVGDPARRILRPAEPPSAGPEEVVVFRRPPSEAELASCRAGIVVLPEATAVPDGRDAVLVADPEMAFIAVLRLFEEPEDFPFGAVGVSPEAAVAASARLASDVTVGPGSSVGERTLIGPGVRIGRNVRIGADCRLYPNVVVHDGSVLGDRVVVKANSVIGGRGFGYHRHGDRHIPIPQIGHVEIGDDTEIGSCVCIDRATIGVTRIGRGVKVDNLVQIAHNVTVGDRTVVVSQVGLSGSVRIGADVVLAGQAGVADHVVIEDGAVVGAQAGVMNRIQAGQVVLGSPAVPAMAFKRSVVHIEKLGELYRRVAALEARMKEDCDA